MEVCIKDVIGPLSDFSGIIVVEADKKVFPIRCSLADAETCHKILTTGTSNGPYAAIASAFQASSMSVTGSALVEREGGLHSSVTLTRGRKKMRLASDNAAMAINLALLSECPLLIDDGCLVRVKDSSRTYNAVRCEIRTLWPMPQLNRTRELQVMTEYMEDAFPDGWSVTINDEGRSPGE